MATALNALAYDIIVEKTTKQATQEAQKKTRPAHHLNDNGTLFCNPWPSYRWVVHDIYVCLAHLMRVSDDAGPNHRHSGSP